MQFEMPTNRSLFGRRHTARSRALAHGLITGQYTTKSPDERGFLVLVAVTDSSRPFPSDPNRNDNDPFPRSTDAPRSAHRAAQPGTRPSSRRAHGGLHPTDNIPAHKCSLHALARFRTLTPAVQRRCLQRRWPHRSQEKPRATTQQLLWPIMSFVCSWRLFLLFTKWN